MEENHDNINVKVNSRVNIYGNVVFVGSISVVSTGFVFLAIFMLTHWSQAVVLSAVLVYGLLSLVALVALCLVVALWMRLVIMPGTDAYERRVEAHGQALRNRVIHAQENAVVVESIPGQLTVFPLFPQQVIEAPKPEAYADKKTVLELFDLGNSLRDIASRTGVSYYNVQKWTSETKKASD